MEKIKNKGVLASMKIRLYVYRLFQKMLQKLNLTCNVYWRKSTNKRRKTGTVILMRSEQSLELLVESFFKGTGRAFKGTV